MKEIKDDINRGGDILCSWVGRINIVKMTILLNATYRFNVIPIKLSVAFFTELEQKISQFVWRHWRPPKAKVILRKKNRQYLEMQTKTTMRDYFTLASMAAIQKSTRNKCWRVWRKGNPLTLLVEMQTSTATMENSVEIP